jgi:hypothetical protein
MGGLNIYWRLPNMSAATLPLSAHQALTLETLNFWADRNVLNLLL